MDNIYGVWTNFTPGNIRVQFNRSTNNGNTYSLPITISTNIGQGANVQTGTNGQVYVCWADYNNNELGARGLGFCRSLNGGVTFTNSQRIFNYNGIRDLNTNSDGSSPTFNNTRINDFPAMSVDKSNGIHRGSIYVTYAAHENGNGKAVIQVAWSDNQGDTWSTPLTVSIPTGRQNWFPWIAVDNCNGEIWLDYYSFDTPSGFTTNTYVAHSVDGGLNWENQRVSDVSHITQAIVAPNIAPGYAGDYIGITAFGGKAYPIWMDNRNGTWQLYCSPVTSNISSYSISGDASFCTTSNPYTIPNLPTGATVQWSVTPSSIATPGTPTLTQTTLTKNSNGIITLTATISNVCGSQQVIVTKSNIVVGAVPPTYITGMYSGKQFANNCTYDFTSTGTSWLIGGGTIISGQGTNTVTVQTGNITPNFNVSVRQTNSCGTSAYFELSGAVVNAGCPRIVLERLSTTDDSSNIVTNNKTDIQKSFVIYPNPAKDELMITSPAFSLNEWVSIYNANGELIHKERINSTQQMLNISSFKAGLYLIKVDINGEIKKVSKIIKL